MSKKLYKSRDNVIISGVCGGVAETFNMDPTIVRILWAILGLNFGIGLIAYLIAAIVMPEKPKDSEDGKNHEDITKDNID